MTTFKQKIHEISEQARGLVYWQDRGKDLPIPDWKLYFILGDITEYLCDRRYYDAFRHEVHVLLLRNDLETHLVLKQDEFEGRVYDALLAEYEAATPTFTTESLESQLTQWLTFIGILH